MNRCFKMDRLAVLEIVDPDELYRPLKEELELEEDGVNVLDSAYALAKLCHDGQLRDEGTAYILHPLRVGLILAAELGISDVGLISAGLLHDVLEDSDMTVQVLVATMGKEVAQMVDTMTKRPLTDYANQDERSMDYHRTILGSSREIKLIKLADRLDNVRGLHLSPDENKKMRYLRWTREMLLPMAKETDEYLYSALSDWCREFASSRSEERKGQ